ncbi:MAG: gliding motility-associated C-terminal domain-containing protein, partial [Cyanobacteria bacterium]|nr:gliding motility-associated C-terminal domain-containing protein [Cyanobacteriota bacterium]
SSSGTFNNNTLLGASYSPSAADYAAGIATLVITSNGHAGCNPVSDTMRIFITPAPTVNLGPALTRCGDVGSITLSSTVANNNNSIAWSILTGAGSLTNATTNNPTYTLGAETIPGAPSITLQATVTPLPAAGTCNNVSQTININLTAIPTVSAGSNTNSCLTNPNALLNGSVTVATGGTWSTSGTGTFSPNSSTLNATYVPSAADLLLPSVNLTLTTTGNGQCAAYNNAITLTFDPLPTISISPDRLVICSGNTVTFTSVITNATGVAWTTNGDGTFNTPTSAITIYTPGPNDITNGGMIITGTSTGVTTCAHAVQNVAIGIVPSPVASVNAGFDQIVCADIDTIQLNGFIAVALGGQWTASTGLGLFLPNTSDLSAQYIPDPSDKVGGNSITITLSSTGNGICAPTSDDMVVNFTPIPTVDAGPDMIICADSAFIQLTPTITTATGGVWTTSGDPNAFAPSASTAGAIYIPTPTDIANGSIGFTLTTTGNGTCQAYNNSLAVTITPKPSISIGPDLNICANATTVSLNAVTTIATSTTWTTSGAGSFAPNPNNASVYTVVPSDTSAQSIVVFGESTNQGACKSTFDTLTINFQSTPIADAGPD